MFICLPAARRAAAASPGQPTVAEQSLRIGWTEMSSARPPRRRRQRGGGQTAAVGCGANRGAAVDVGMQSYAAVAAQWRTAAVRRRHYQRKVRQNAT